MTKKFKFLSGAIRAILGSTLLLGFLFVVSCDNGGDDPEPELYPLPGVYTFHEAILQTSLTVPGTTITLPAGTNITEQMAGGLLAEAPCDNPENGAVELKSNNELFFACMGETNELKAGTWSINSDTTTLSLNLTVPQPLQLNISELEIDEQNNIIGGRIGNFPITKTLVAGFVANLPNAEAILAGIDDTWVQMVNVDIKFKKETGS